MKWFKHYTNARTSNALTEIKAQYGLQGYGRYWTLLELMCEKFNGKDDRIFVFETRRLREDLGYFRTSDLIKFLSSLNQVGLICCIHRNQVIEIESDIMLKLQGRDWKNNSKKRAENAPKNKSKDIDKEKEREARTHVPRTTSALSFLDPDLLGWLGEISDPMARRWVKEYPKSFLEDQISQAMQWHEAQSGKKRWKNIPLGVNKWLRRSIRDSSFTSKRQVDDMSESELFADVFLNYSKGIHNELQGLFSDAQKTAITGVSEGAHNE